MIVLIVIPVFVFAYVAWAVFYAGHFYEKRQITMDRFSFAVEALFASQVGFSLILAGLVVLSAGFILFAAPILVFANALVGVVSFVTALVIYGRYAKKWRAAGVSAYVRLPLTVLSVLVKMAISLFLLVYLFTRLNGVSVALQLLDDFSVATNQPGLVKYQTYAHERDFSYRRIAVKTHNPGLCENMSTREEVPRCVKEVLAAMNSMPESSGAQPNTEEASIKALSGTVDTLATTAVSGTVPSGDSVDIYIYGPNNGNVGFNPQSKTGFEVVGELVFSAENVPVVQGHWSIQITPALLPNSFYQVNIGTPMRNANLRNSGAWSLTMTENGDEYMVRKTNQN